MAVPFFPGRGGFAQLVPGRRAGGSTMPAGGVLAVCWRYRGGSQARRSLLGVPGPASPSQVRHLTGAAAWVMRVNGLVMAEPAWSGVTGRVRFTAGLRPAAAGKALPVDLA